MAGTFARGDTYDAIVVGSGPNGLAAAITLAREGLGVLVVEARDEVGGGTRTAELTLPGFWHDVCSAIHPLAVASPFFRTLPMADLGVAWVHPDAPLVHALDGGRAVVMERSVDATARALGADAARYRRLFGPWSERFDDLLGDLLGPLKLPAHPLLAADFGLRAIQPARHLAESWFEGEEARALFAGLAAHSILPLERLATASFGLMLGLAAHAVGWPLPRGGSRRIAQAMADHLRSLGGRIEMGWNVQTLDELPASRATLLDLTPRQVLGLASDRLPPLYRRRLGRYRYGPGAFKVDWALDGPIPWENPACARGATVHLGGSLEEIAAGEAAVGRGEIVERPFVLLAQQSLFDPSRAPAGKHTGWAYCHVPNGSRVDMTERIERQVERFAPGFRDRILARHVMAPADFERYNANDVGGDINGGAQDITQLFTRPVARLTPYATPSPGLYLCSASTPPGGGVHGMCGASAAHAALRQVFRRRPDELLSRP